MVSVHVCWCPAFGAVPVAAPCRHRWLPPSIDVLHDLEAAWVLSVGELFLQFLTPLHCNEFLQFVTVFHFLPLNLSLSRGECRRSSWLHGTTVKSAGWRVRPRRPSRHPMHNMPLLPIPADSQTVFKTM